MKSVIITNVGKVVPTATAQSIVLTSDKPINDSCAALVTQLGERALATFVSTTLKLPKALTRIKTDDIRIQQAVEAVFANGSGEAAAAGKAAKTATAKATTKAAATTTTAAKKTPAERAPGTKQVLYEFLTGGQSGTFEELVKLTGSSEGSVRTALTDLKNAKYAYKGQAIAIDKSDDGVFSLAGTKPKAAKPAAAKPAAAAAAPAAPAKKVATKKAAKA